MIHVQPSMYMATWPIEHLEINSIVQLQQVAKVQREHTPSSSFQVLQSIPTGDLIDD